MKTMSKLRSASLFFVLFFRNTLPMEVIRHQKRSRTDETCQTTEGLEASSKQAVGSAFDLDKLPGLFEFLENELKCSPGLRDKMWKLVENKLIEKAIEKINRTDFHWVLYICGELPESQDSLCKKLLDKVKAAVENSLELGILKAGPAQNLLMEIDDIDDELDCDIEGERLPGGPPTKHSRVGSFSLDWAERVNQEVRTAIENSDFRYAFDNITNNLTEKINEPLRKELLDLAKKRLKEECKKAIKIGEFDYARYELIEVLPESEVVLRRELNARWVEEVVKRQPREEPSVNRQGITGKSGGEYRVQEASALHGNLEIMKKDEEASEIFQGLETVYTCLSNGEKRGIFIDKAMRKMGSISPEMLLRTAVDESFQKADILQKVQQDTINLIYQVGKAAELANTDRARDAYSSALSSSKHINELYVKTEKYAQRLKLISI